MVELDAVLAGDPADLDDRVTDCGGIVALVLGQEIDIPGRASLSEGRKQNASLQHETFGQARRNKSVEEAFQNLELEELIDWAALSERQFPDVQVGTPGCGGPRRRRHSSTSSACRSGLSAPGKCRATSRRRAGLLPGTSSQLRNASQAMSLPALWRSRMMSTSDRSAE